MYFTGFADEASQDIDLQIKATLALGWKNIETRALYGKNLAFLSDKEFEDAEEKLEKSGIHFNCYGSGIGNWAKPIAESPESSYEEFRKAIPRMQKLGISMVRMMSFNVADDQKENAWQYEDEAIKRVKVIVKMAEDAGILCVHENCMNWGGLSYEHTLKLCEKIKSPNFKLVFDTGNPVFNIDYSGAGAHKKRQSAWEFYQNVKDFIAYIHIKDGTFVEETGQSVFLFPDEGDAQVSKILTDVFNKGYDGGISIEPHMKTVFHDKKKMTPEFEKECYDNYVEYGRRVEKIVTAIKNKLGK
ncbi:MAG: sugar phosphate isomerase/epimerase family protein [Lentisphaeria bacterium]